MTCPICDQKPANCDCTETERSQHREINDLSNTIAGMMLNDDERSLIAMIADHPRTHEIEPHEVAILRRLLERLGGAG